MAAARQNKIDTHRKKTKNAFAPTVFSAARCRLVDGKIGIIPDTWRKALLGLPFWVLVQVRIPVTLSLFFLANFTPDTVGLAARREARANRAQRYDEQHAPRQTSANDMFAFVGEYLSTV